MKCLLVPLLFFMVGCDNAITKSFGGTTKVDLPVNEKLLNITWKESDLWYLTRPMTASDSAVVYSFKEQSNMGVFSGEVIITEHKEIAPPIESYFKQPHK